MKKKIILSSLLALGVLGGVVGLAHGPVGVEAANITGGITFNLEPNSNWASDNARFAMYLCNGSSSAEWYSMSDNDGDGIYSATVKAGMTHKNIIFCRMNPSTSTNDWNNRWNQTGDLTWDGTNNLYTMKEGTWDSGTWSNFSDKITFMGTMTDWSSGVKMTESNGQFKFEYTSTTEAEHKFKVKVSNQWLGHSKLKVSGIEVKNDSDDNCVFTANGNGKYEFTYYYADNKLNLDVEFIPNVTELFTEYYNSGTYVKETVLNTNEFADEDVNDYFHAGAQVKYRQTTYTPGQLSMVTKATSEAEWGTHTSTYKDNGNGVDHLTDGVKDYSVSGTVNGQDRSSVEDWYVTLHDFVNTELTGWEYADGVYTLSLKNNELATKMAREFVAPMWLETEEAKNYVQFDKLTVEEVDESLVMKLYVDSTNGGQLVEGANLVFSQATITKKVNY